MNPITRRDFLKASGSLVVSVSLPGAVAASQGADERHAAAASRRSCPTSSTRGSPSCPTAASPRSSARWTWARASTSPSRQIVAEELDVAVRARQRRHGRHRPHLQPGRRLRQHRHPARRHHAAQRRGRSAAHPRRARARRSSACRHVRAHRRERRGDGAGLRAAARELRRADRRPALPSQARVEQAATAIRSRSRSRRSPRTPREYKVVGKSFPQKVITDKVMGRAQYITDVRVEGMLHARVIRPPNAGCNPVAVDESSIAGIPGARVVREKDFLAVVADREWDAVRAAEMLKVTWSARVRALPADGHALPAHPRGEGERAAARRSTAATSTRRSKTAARVVEAEYEWPLQSHASMGPACAIADMNERRAAHVDAARRNRITCRVGSARICGLPSEKVRATWVMGPGSYGRNDAGDAARRRGAALEAHRAHGARAVHAPRRRPAGIPKGPAARVPRPRRARCGRQRRRLPLPRQGLLAAGRGAARGRSQGHARRPAHRLGAARATSSSRRPRSVYDVREQALRRGKRYRRCSTAPRRCAPGTCAIRSGAETHFASESFIDEVAHAAGADPGRVPAALPEGRARTPRSSRRSRRRRAGRRGPNPNRGKGDVMTGRGVSYTERNGTVVAMIAEVEVDRAQRPRVGEEVHGRARLRPDHQPGRAAGSRSKATSCRRCRARCSRKCASTRTA